MSVQFERNTQPSDQAHVSASSANSTTSPSEKNNLNDAAKKAGELASKAFAMGKAATKDIAQELKNVNEIRKETVATAEAGTTKKELAKGFWAKLSGKQKAIMLGMIVLFVLLINQLTSSDLKNIPSGTYYLSCKMNALVNNGTGEEQEMRKNINIDVNAQGGIANLGVENPDNGTFGKKKYQFAKMEKHVKGDLYFFNPISNDPLSIDMRLFNEEATGKLIMIYFLPRNIFMKGTCKVN